MHFLEKSYEFVNSLTNESACLNSKESIDFQYSVRRQVKPMIEMLSSGQPCGTLGGAAPSRISIGKGRYFLRVINSLKLLQLIIQQNNSCRFSLADFQTVADFCKLADSSTVADFQLVPDFPSCSKSDKMVWRSDLVAIC